MIGGGPRMILHLSSGPAAVRRSLSTWASDGLCFPGVALTVGLRVGTVPGGVTQAAWVVLSAKP